MTDEIRAVEFEIPGVPETQFLVPDEKAVLALRLRRSRCWTPADVEATRGLSREERKAVAEARLIFDGQIRTRKAPEAPRPTPPRTTFVSGASAYPSRGVRASGAPARPTGRRR